MRRAAVFATTIALGLATVAHADPPPSDALSIRLAGLRNDHGRAGCSLYATERGFPGDSNAALQRVWCPIASSTATCRFDGVVAGTYAVACFHDENANGRCDTGMFGIPTEGTVVSNEAKGFMGPPKFQNAKFTFSGRASELRLRVSY